MIALDGTITVAGSGQRGNTGDSDVRVTPAMPQLKVLQRRLADGEVYFWFNEGTAPLDVDAERAGAGAAQHWDPVTGATSAVTSTVEGGRLRAKLHFEGNETKLVVIGQGQGRPSHPSPATEWTTLLEIGGDWDLELETQANELFGDPARFREIEAKGWLKGSYVGIYGKFDREMIPSGLVGPVRLVVEGSRDAVKKPGRPVRAAGSEGPPGLAAAQTDWFHRQ